MYSKETYARVETQDVVAHLLGTNKDLNVAEMLGGLLSPCNKASYTIH